VPDVVGHHLLGGVGELVGRPLAHSLEKFLKQPVVVTNKPGAAGAVGNAFVASSEPDGYKLLMSLSSISAIPEADKLFNRKPAYTLDQLTPIARLTSEYNVFVVPGDSPLKTMKDVVEQLKKDPGSVKWGGGSRGSTEHISACMLARNVGVDPKKVNYVAFRGGGEAVAAILGGNVTVGGSGYSEFAEHIEAGKMRAIAIGLAKRYPDLAEVPTFAEQGLPDYNVDSWYSLHAPAGTPKNIVERLNAEVNKALAQPDIVQKLESQALDPWPSTPEEFSARLKTDFDKYAKLIRLSGAKIE